MLEFLDLWWVLALTALAWHYVLKCGFVSDDHAVIAERKDIIPDHEKNPRRESYWTKVFNDGIVMFYLNRGMRKLIGNNPAGWHALSFAIHLTNTALLYHVVSMYAGPKYAGACALIWAVNPMQNQIVGWCSGRPYGIATMFALVSMLCWRDPVIVVPLYIFGVITSVSIGFLPVILKMAHPGTWQGSFYIAMMVAMIPFVLWKFKKRFSVNALVMDRRNFHFRPRRFNNIVRVFVYYLASLCFPVTMGWYHDAGFGYNEKWDGFNIWAVIGYAVVIFIATQGYPGAWFLLGLLPQMNIFATNSYVQDRYLYFASMGLSIMLAPFFVQYPVLFVAACAIYMSKSYTYSRHMINDEQLYRENWRNHPRSEWAINNLAFFVIQKRGYEEARAYIDRGLAINKGNKMLWYNLGITWAATAHFQSQEGIQRFFRAMECWKKALQIEPRWKKPMEDLQKVVKILVDNKIVTLDKNLAAPGMPAIHAPLLNKEELLDAGTDNPKT